MAATDVVKIYKNKVSPGSADIDLGSNSSKWGDIYFSGSLIGTLSRLLYNQNDLALFEDLPCFAIDATTNLSGQTLSAYSAVPSTIEESTVLIIKYNSLKTTEAQAREYMRLMTGAASLPVYDNTHPNMGIFIMEGLSVWRASYDSTNGLVLYYLTTLIKSITNGQIDSLFTSN